MIPPPQQCDCLSAVGMSVECLDSYCPSHHKCDHVVKPSCWGASHSPQQSERDKVLDEVLERMYKLQKKGMFTCLFLRHEIRALRTIKQEEQG